MHVGISFYSHGLVVRKNKVESNVKVIQKLHATYYDFSVFANLLDSYWLIYFLRDETSSFF